MGMALRYKSSYWKRKPMLKTFRQSFQKHNSKLSKTYEPYIVQYKPNNHPSRQRKNPPSYKIFFSFKGLYSLQKPKISLLVNWLMVRRAHGISKKSLLSRENFVLTLEVDNFQHTKITMCSYGSSCGEQLCWQPEMLSMSFQWLQCRVSSFRSRTVVRGSYRNTNKVKS